MDNKTVKKGAPMEAMLTTEQVAELLHYRRDYLCVLFRAGTIPAKRIGKRWLVKPADIRALLDGEGGGE